MCQNKQRLLSLMKYRKFQKDNLSRMGRLPMNIYQHYILYKHYLLCFLKQMLYQQNKKHKHFGLLRYLIEPQQQRIYQQDTSRTSTLHHFL